MEEAIVCLSTFAVGRDAISTYVATPSLSRSVAVAGSRADKKAFFVLSLFYEYISVVR